MVKATVFDCFGVLATEGWIPFRDAVALLTGFTPEEVGSYMSANNPNDELFTLGELALFDVCVLSSEIGYAKPDEKAYLYVTDLLDVAPEGCVFIDDRLRYLEGARAIGMPTMLYTEFSLFRHNLEKLLANP